MNETDAEVYLLIGILAAVFLFALIMGLARFLNHFSGELRYLNSEIGRTEGRERKFWIRRRRKLWLSILPFIKY